MKLTHVGTATLLLELANRRVLTDPALDAPGIEIVDSKTTGFVLEWPGQTRGVLYVSGDTVYFEGIEEIGRRFRVATAILHLGGVRFPLTGPLRYTFTAAQASRAASRSASRWWFRCTTRGGRTSRSRKRRSRRHSRTRGSTFVGCRAERPWRSWSDLH